MRTRRLRPLLAALAVLALATPSGATAADARQDVIVVFRDGVSGARGLAAALTKAHGTTPKRTYEHALQGFAARLPASAVRAIRARADVAMVTTDAAVHIADTTQSPATWGLDRIDQRDLPLSNSYTYGATGSGVEAYVIDTGILFTHQDFGSRATFGADVVGDGRNGVDCHGHGTHVAGTIGGQTYGVAKAVKLVAVRVFDCVGNTSWSQIISGVDYVTGQKQARPGTPMVANMSIEGPPDAAVDLAVSNSIGAGVSYAIAAGNGNIFGFGVDACGVSPGRVAAAMTVAATGTNDTRATFSNYGSCVDWFAPGVNIVSDGISSPTSTATKTGTSMAAPHTAGVAALYLETHPTASPATVRDALFDATTKDKVGAANSANDHLLYSRVTTSPPNQPPSAGDVSVSTSEDTSVSWTPVVSDPDAGAPLSCVIVSQPAHGSATVAAGCSSGSYTPAANTNGTDAFTYRVSDGTATDTGTVTVTISAVNDRPSAGNDSYSSAAGTALVRTAPGVLANDTDVENDALTATGATAPAHGALTLNADGGFTYTPAAGYSGPDSFTYRAADGSSTSDPATVSITVTAASATTMRVTDLDATASRKGQTWTASVTIEVRNDLGAAVSGATVTGDFTSGGGTGRTCVTSSTGRCTITSLHVSRTVASLSFTVRSVSHPTLTYTPASNSESDGDSNGTTITKARP